MKKLFAVAVFAATVSGLGAANAMPLAPLSAADTAAVIQVAQGCGPGYARGPRGFCRPMGGGFREPGRGYREPFVVVRPRGCPPGLAFRMGRCRPF